MGGMVLETNMSEIMLRIEEQGKIEKEEVISQFWNTQISFFFFIYNSKDSIV